jgi:hypothetical protein
MDYYFHSSAEEELFEAIEYYEECSEGLGLEFVREVYSSIQNIISYPSAWPPLSKNTRRCIINRFPYGVIYQEKREEIYIIAVMHLHKRPEYWENR